jgi:hypothetical protein
MLGEIEKALAGVRFTVSDEAELQRAVDGVLCECIGFTSWMFDDEVKLTERDRIDFTIYDQLNKHQLPYGIELKVKGSAANVHRQLKRYAKTGKLQGLMLVTTLRKHGAIEALWDPRSIPLRVVVVSGGAI